MANPLPYKPKPVDPREELARRVSAAPVEHAEALLSAWGLLETAHRQGVLDLVRGLMAGRDELATHVSEAAARPESVRAVRNVIALGRLLAALDPETLERMVQTVGTSTVEASRPPSLWRVARMVFSEDGRRGMAFAAGFLVGLGRAVAKR